MIAAQTPTGHICDAVYQSALYPSCLTSLRWQIGRNGDDHFTLIAYGSTPGRLIGCLEARARSQGRNGH